MEFQIFLLLLCHKLLVYLIFWLLNILFEDCCFLNFKKNLLAKEYEIRKYRIQGDFVVVTCKQGL